MVFLARSHFSDARRTHSLLLDRHARYLQGATNMELDLLGAIGASFYELA